MLADELGLSLSVVARLSRQRGLAAVVVLQQLVLAVEELVDVLDLLALQVAAGEGGELATLPLKLAGVPALAFDSCSLPVEAIQRVVLASAPAPQAGVVTQALSAVMVALFLVCAHPKGCLRPLGSSAFVLSPLHLVKVVKWLRYESQSLRALRLHIEEALLIAILVSCLWSPVREGLSVALGQGVSASDRVEVRGVGRQELALVLLIRVVCAVLEHGVLLTLLPSEVAREVARSSPSLAFLHSELGVGDDGATASTAVTRLLAAAVIPAAVVLELQPLLPLSLRWLPLARLPSRRNLRVSHLRTDSQVHDSTCEVLRCTKVASTLRYLTGTALAAPCRAPPPAPCTPRYARSEAAPLGLPLTAAPVPVWLATHLGMVPV